MRETDLPVTHEGLSLHRRVFVDLGAGLVQLSLSGLQVLLTSRPPTRRQPPAEVHRRVIGGSRTGPVDRDGIGYVPVGVPCEELPELAANVVEAITDLCTFCLDDIDMPTALGDPQGRLCRPDQRYPCHDSSEDRHVLWGGECRIDAECVDELCNEPWSALHVHLRVVLLAAERQRVRVRALPNAHSLLPPLEDCPYGTTYALGDSLEERLDPIDDHEDRCVDLEAQLVDDLAQLLANAAQANLVAEDANHRRRRLL